MAAEHDATDQIARDDAHLRSLGINPELRRTLGFLSNFAIAFSFISVSTGSFGNFGYGIVAQRVVRPLARSIENIEGPCSGGRIEIE